MNLVIRARTLNDRPMSPSIVGRFDVSGGTIGRSDANTMTLPDPERRISRLQAEISGSESGFRMRNVGGATAIFVNDRALAPGDVSELHSGDELRIGGYALGVAFEAADSRERTVTGPRPKVDARAVIVGSAVESRTHPPAREPGRATKANPSIKHENPFADLLGPGTPDDPPGALQTAPAAPMAASATPVPSAPPPDDLFGSLGLGNPHQSAFDDLFGPGPASRAHDSLPTAEPVRHHGIDDVMAPQASLDPLAMFDEAPAPRLPPGPPASDHVPELRGAYQPPAIARPDTDPFAALGLPLYDPPAAAPPLADCHDDVPPSPAALWAAFCEGTGVPGALAGGLSIAQMRTIGRIGREATDGAVRLAALRTLAKNEMRAAVTTIRAGNNNPLKFSPDAEAAITQTMQPPLRGFMAGPEAMQDCMHDLVGHTIGTLAGMRAALRGMLERFEPARLEARLANGGLLDSLIPHARKARLWELYLQHFESIRAQAQDDFHSLFGAAFVAAYEAQLDQLDRPVRT